MSLMLLADSNVERIWLNARNNREKLQTAIYVPVKRADQLQSGFLAMQSSVSIYCYLYCDLVFNLSGVFKYYRGKFNL